MLKNWHAVYFRDSPAFIDSPLINVEYKISFWLCGPAFEKKRESVGSYNIALLARPPTDVEKQTFDASLIATHGVGLPAFPAALAKMHTLSGCATSTSSPPSSTGTTKATAAQTHLQPILSDPPRRRRSAHAVVTAGPK